MENHNNSLYTRQRKGNGKDNIIPLNPKFTDLSRPETFAEHFHQLTNNKPTLHSEILNQLIEQFIPLDFETIANPKGNNDDNFKLTHKHYLVLSIENVIAIAEKNKWGLCKQHDIIYLYNGCYWDKVCKETFYKFLGEAAERMGVPKFSARYYQFRKHLYEQFLGTAYFESKLCLANKVLINLQNGTFEVTTKGTQLRAFDRRDFITYQLPFKYDPQAKAPLFKSFLNRVLPDIERQKVLAEYLGYLFIKNGSNQLKEEKALILYGTGANGKSVMFETVKALLGPENISNYSLQSLTNENGYFRAKIANKLVNYATEINGKLQCATFKQLVSGEPVEARLPYGEPFTLGHYAKLMFNCNELPRDVEITNAYFRRFLIIHFEVTIPEHEMDTLLHTKIIENELSGVFNWVLEGLDRLLEQKRFTHSDAINKAVEQYKNESDSVKLFIDENNYQISPNDYRLIKDLYSVYRVFSLDGGFRPVNKTNFIKRLKGFGVVVENVTGNKLAAYVSDSPINH
ncbi:DNA primase family protein [Zobellia barbeyronii]|uniref:DNA primase n=1 Tax=Zobellia barbeyronii TaxID=2748009 RepID=A0ABS5WJQ5_9FLAO|nr:DNA primase family protein [Zobellia barbeyronii]MBT2163523.1 DNA primase [Zobellia barbeyronii]